jgi:hypothetical protein
MEEECHQQCHIIVSEVRHLIDTNDFRDIPLIAFRFEIPKSKLKHEFDDDDCLKV